MLTTSPLVPGRSPPPGFLVTHGSIPARRRPVRHPAGCQLLRTFTLACALVSLCVFGTRPASADGPADNNSETARRIPALGIEVPPAQREQLTAGLTRLQQAIDKLQSGNNPLAKKLLPDVQIFHKAVADALEFQEFFNEKELAPALDLLNQGLQRAAELEAGRAPWTTQTGLVVRGYLSRIDGSVQPYGLVVPDSYLVPGPVRHRLDLWFHGRGETLSEVNFLVSRQRDRGIFTPPDAFVLHPYGRYCNAFKFAGEIDVLEALAHVEANYRIDPDRIASRGFSMGGAACWQFAVHYPDRFVGATPGAGFSETPEFLKFFQKETLTPAPWEQTLWRMHDCPDWAGNLRHCPTIAYSGENDTQKQAADIMESALAKLGIELVHLIGPQTGHSYHPAVRDEIERRFNAIVARGRDRAPREVHFTTYTLRYNRCFWVTVEGLAEHWQKATVDATWTSGNSLTATTSNVTALTFALPPGDATGDPTRPVELTIDGQALAASPPRSDRSWSVALTKSPAGWQLGRPAAATRKQPGLQGPIDDALMDSFVFVTPTSPGDNPAVDQWVASEQARAIEHWRRQFRGRPRVVTDAELTPELIAGNNLILWGTPRSNRVLGQVAERLPIAWKPAEISVGSQSFPAAHHALILCAPNPLNPARYVVLNSSFTYREYDYLNNARQVSKLPDWAVVDLRTPPGVRWPGKIVAADFFNEAWQLKPAQ